MEMAPSTDEAREHVDWVRLDFLNGGVMALTPFLTAFLTDAALRDNIEVVEHWDKFCEAGVDAREVETW
jgi:hypothetical protein